MTSPKKLLILGTGGNSVDILDTVHERNTQSKTPQYECIGFLDDGQKQWGKAIWGVPVLGPLESAPRYPEAYFVNGIGSERNFWKKAAIIAKTRLPLDRFATIVHPTASVSRMATLGQGVVVFQHVTITNQARIGHHVIILPNSVISHERRPGGQRGASAATGRAGGANGSRGRPRRRPSRRWRSASHPSKL